MQLSEFEASPTKHRHPTYDNSICAGTAPEHSTGEVLLGAAYRRLVLGIDDKETDLADIPRLAECVPENLPREIWATILLEKGGIRSPLKSGQTASHPEPQLMPIVPSIARVASVLGRRKRNRWEPSNLLLEAIGAALGPIEGATFTRSLGTALTVGAEDDVFARFLDQKVRNSLSRLSLPMPGSDPPTRLESVRVRAFRNSTGRRSLSPAERFCEDLKSVIPLKRYVTRRQWTVLVEAILRLGLGMHALWVCHLNWIIWQQVLSVASGEPLPTRDELEHDLWESHQDTRPLLDVGAPARPLFERLIEHYAYGRLGLNILFYRLDDVGASWPTSEIIGYSDNGPSAVEQVERLLTHVASNRTAIDSHDAGKWLKERLSQLVDHSVDLRRLAKCKYTWSRNLYFFARHSLGQIESGDAELRSYDQSFLISSSAPRRPLKVQPGPAMLITLVHACCGFQRDIPVSLENFRRHLAGYGLRVPAGELIGGKTGNDLEQLGLVVDSPDAAGGRLLVPPF